MNAMQVPEFSVSQAERGAEFQSARYFITDPEAVAAANPQLLLLYATWTALVALTAPAPTGEEFP